MAENTNYESPAATASGNTLDDVIRQRLVASGSQFSPASSAHTRQESIIKMWGVALTAALSTAEPRRVGDSALETAKFVLVGDAATDEQATILKLREQLARVLTKAFNEEFRDGMPSEFSNDLHNLVMDYGSVVVREIQRVLAAHEIDTGVGFEALTLLASFDYKSIASDRLRLVEWALASPTPEIRYGAALALATLRDPVAIGPLKTAIRREAIPDLRKALERVLRAFSGE